MTNLYRFTLHPSVSLRSIAQHLPFTYTGADFYALCSDAMLKAVTRQASGVDAKIAEMAAASGKKPMSTAYYFDHYATPEDVAVLVTEQDFLEANHELVPSISAGELSHYERVRETFEGNRQKQKEEKARREQQLEQQQQQSQSQGSAASIIASLASSSLAAGTLSASSAAVRPTSRGKGKGKAVEVDDDEAEDGNGDDDDDDTGSVIMNGRVKGKGKAPAGSAFQDQRVSDDEDLYD